MSGVGPGSDGAPGRAPRLWRYLWAWVLGALLLAWVVLVAAAYVTGVHEAEEVTDGQLATMARLWLQAPLPSSADRVASPRFSDAEPSMPQPPQRYAPDVHVVLWQQGDLVWDSHGWAPRLPADAPVGYHTWELPDGDRRRPWRWLVAQQGARRVAVGLDASRHPALGRDIATHLVRPAVVLLPVLALLLAWAIRRGLRPLTRLAERLRGWEPGQPMDWPVQCHEELLRVQRALQDLVQRLHALWQRERRFTSDVAHELRSPLQALVWQARLARTQPHIPEGQAALAQVEHEALRAGELVTQLLALARADAPGAEPAEPVDLAALVREVVARLQPMVDARGQHVQTRLQPAIVWGHPTLIHLAVRNLVDNALRHTPSGSRVDVRLGCEPDGAVVLQVVDDGGAAQRALQAASDRGGLGVGLGLVQRIAEREGALLQRVEPPPSWTTAYQLRWPRGAVR